MGSKFRWPLFIFLMFLSFTFSPLVFAADFTDSPWLILGFLVYTAFSWWFATVMMIFGMTFWQGFLLGYSVWAISIYYGDDYSKRAMELERARIREGERVRQEAPERASIDPLKFMNLT